MHAQRCVLLDTSYSILVTTPFWQDGHVMCDGEGPTTGVTYTSEKIINLIKIYLCQIV